MTAVSVSRGKASRPETMMSSSVRCWVQKETDRERDGMRIEGSSCNYAFHSMN